MSMISINNNPKIYFWANLLGSVSFLTPVMSLFYLHRGLVYSDFFILLLIIVITMFLFEVPTGAFADKYGPKASMIFGQFLAIISAVLLIFANTKFEFYLISFLTGIAITFFSGCDEALIYDSLKEQKKEKTMSKMWGKIQSATYIPAIITVIAGAIIAKDLTENQFLILIYIGLFFAITKLVPLFLLKNPDTYYKKLNRQSPFYHVGEGIKFLRKTPYLLLIFLNETLVFIPLHVFNKFDQPFLIDNGLAVALLGVLYAISSLFAYFISQNINFIEKKIPTKTIIGITGIGILLAYLSAAFVKNIYVAILIFFILRLSNVIRYPIFSQIKNDYIPSGSRATTLSLLSMIDSFFDVIIFSSLAFIANMGLPIIFLGSAIIVFIGLLFPVKLKSDLNKKTSP